jgi:GH35 family endo-1,4-beta-xylanase
MNYATLPFYWGGYEPAAGEEQRDRLLAMAQWCRDHGVRTKGHPLAWHEVFPKWAEALEDTQALRRLRDRIAGIVREFRGLVDTWDVFNETTVADRFENAVGRWVRDRGAVECVAEALGLARAANPDAELLYNDFNVSPAFEELVAQLSERGAPFDAIGIQSHMHKGAWTPEKTWATCEAYARFGLPLHFTETTLLSGRLKGDEDNDWHRRRTDWGSTPEGEQRQLEEGRRFYTLLFSHPAVDAVTWWDFSDRHAWQGAPAGLLRSDMSPKPLAEWLRKAFGEDFATRTEVRTDENGEARFRGFYGVYALRATAENGTCLAGACALPRRAARDVEATVD